MRRLFISSVCLLSLSACSFFDSSPDKKPLEGERISILDLQRELTPRANSKNSNEVISIPDAIKNKAWPQRGGYPNHVMQNLALGDTSQLERIWRADIGKGTTKNLPLTAQPVIAAGKVFTLDTASEVRAFHDQTGKFIWKTDVSHLTDEDSVISGGVAYDDGKLFVTSGYNEVLALSAETGEIVWRTEVSAGSRAAPTIKNGRVFITALNNNAIALDAQNGKVLWEYEGVGETTGLLGAASPTADDQMVIPAFSSGDLVALRVKNGSIIWNDSLANSLRLGGMAGLSDIRGLPVMNGDMVLAVSFGGKMAAYDKRNGARLWQREISSAETPWVAGNTVYVLSADYKLMALSLMNGEIIWVSDVQKYKNRQDRKGLLTWSGPIMAGGRLILTATNGRIVEYNPSTGEKTTTWDTKLALHTAPIVANGTLYLLSDDGSLLAYR
jgi:outer membrane protein assembly factor BamB